MDKQWCKRISDGISRLRIGRAFVEKRILTAKELQELEKVVTRPDIEFIRKMRRLHELNSRKSGAMN